MQWWQLGDTPAITTANNGGASHTCRGCCLPATMQATTPAVSTSWPRASHLLWLLPVQQVHQLGDGFIRLWHHVTLAWALEPVGVEGLELHRQRPRSCGRNVQQHAAWQQNIHSSVWCPARGKCVALVYGAVREITTRMLVNACGVPMQGLQHAW